MLVVLACSLSVSASSADWSAPEALWSSDLSASELEARHSEFLMAADASSTGPANYSSSTSAGVVAVSVPVADKPIVVDIVTDVSSCKTNPSQLSCGFTEEGKSTLYAGVKSGLDFPKLEGEQFVANFTSASGAVSSSSGAAAAAAFASSSTAAGRRLLQASGVKASFDFIGSSLDGGANAKKTYAAFFETLKCTTSECLEGVKTKYNLPAAFTSSSALTTLSNSVDKNSVTADDAAVTAGSNAALGVGDGSERLVESNGGPRKTNIGYYVLGAVLLAFIVAALIYFIVHKKPAATLVKEEPLRRDEVAMAPVVAAPAPHSGVVVAEEAPLAANQQQMDYRSVFALKHNVLDKNAEQKAAEEDEHNHNDVHFILHQ